MKRRATAAGLALALLTSFAWTAACDSSDATDPAGLDRSQTAAAFRPPRLAPTPAVSDIKTTVAVDADAATPGIDGAASYAPGSEFRVAFVLAQVGGGYHGYQFDIEWDPQGWRPAPRPGRSKGGEWPRSA